MTIQSFTRLYTPSIKIRNNTQPTKSNLPLLPFGSSASAPSDTALGKPLSKKEKKRLDIENEKKRKTEENRLRREGGRSGVQLAMTTTSTLAPEPVTTPPQIGATYLKINPGFKREAAEFRNAFEQHKRGEISEADLEYHSKKFEEAKRRNSTALTVPIPETMTIGGQEMSFNQATQLFKVATQVIAKEALEKGKE